MRKEWIFGVALTLVSGAALAAGTGNGANNEEPVNYESADPGAADFGTWDTNNDDRISEAEFTEGVEDVGLYDDWDANDDQKIQQDEFRQVGNAEFGEFDTNNDEVVTQDEFNAGLFDLWDINSDGFLLQDEWDDAGDAGWLDI